MSAYSGIQKGEKEERAAGIKRARAEAFKKLIIHRGARALGISLGNDGNRHRGRDWPRCRAERAGHSWLRDSLFSASLKNLKDTKGEQTTIDTERYRIQGKEGGDREWTERGTASWWIRGKLELAL